MIKKMINITQQPLKWKWTDPIDETRISIPQKWVPTSTFLYDHIHFDDDGCYMAPPDLTNAPQLSIKVPTIIGGR